MNIYAENILDHYKNPRNFGEMKDADIFFKEVNVVCGDEIEIYAKIKDEKIEEIRFKGKGCAISQASTSILTDYVKGKEVKEVEKLGLKDMEKIVGIRVVGNRVNCFLLGLKALQKGIALYKTKHQKQY